MKHLPLVSIVIPMHNGSSTIQQTLKSVIKQKYPIKEIIIVNDASTDDSERVVREFAKNNEIIKIIILKNNTNMMIARTISKGVYVAKSKYIVLTHADCKMVSTHEIAKLIKPFLVDNTIVATYGSVSQPINIWIKFSFWEKFLFAFQVGKIIPGLMGKIDCIKKDAYEKIGGHDLQGHGNYGGEDADIHMRLKKIGNTVPTDAIVEHLHYIYNDFSFGQMLAKRKEVSQAYGVLLNRYGFKIGFMGLLATFLKPILAVGLLIPMTFYVSVLITFILFLYYYKRMFLTFSVVTNPLIVFTPVVFIFLVYYETFWTVRAYIHELLSEKSSIIVKVIK